MRGHGAERRNPERAGGQGIGAGDRDSRQMQSCELRAVSRDGRVALGSSENEGGETCEAVNHDGITPKAMAAAVITIEAAKRNGIENRWCSPNSMPERPQTRKVAGVRGLTGKPVVI